MTRDHEIKIKVGYHFKDVVFNYKCYIVDILDKEKEPQIVYRYYKKYQPYAYYRVMAVWLYNMKKETGCIK